MIQLDIRSSPVATGGLWWV